MTSFQPRWTTATVSIRVLGAISGGESDPLRSPDLALGDPQTDYVIFEIPRFQRGLRWSEEKRGGFLESLRQGLPIGAIVLARRPNLSVEGHPGPVKKWYVLDGQQRIFATQKLLATFWTHERYDFDACGRSILDLSQSLPGNPDVGQLRIAISDVIRNGNGVPEDSSPFLQKICVSGQLQAPIGEDPDVQERALHACTLIRQELESQFEGLESYPVPALLLTPDLSSNLAEQQNTLTSVFKSLNDFVKLDKYELIAAKWAGNYVMWEPSLPNHVGLIRWLFKKMEDRISDTYADENEIFDYDPNIEELTKENVNAFDLVYALSKSISVQVPVASGTEVPRYLFRLGEAGSNIAFDILNLFSQRSLSHNLDDLPRFFPKGQDAGALSIDATNIIVAVTDAANKIQSILADQLFPAPSSLPATSKPLGAIQSAVYLANFMAITRNHSDYSARSGTIPLANEPNLTVSKASKDWGRNLAAWWLRDILSDDFQGGDAYQNAASRVWAGEEPSTVMCRPPSQAEMIGLLNSRFIADSARISSAPKRRVPNEAIRAIMQICARSALPSQGWQSDHVVAFKSDPANGRAPLEHPIPLNHIANWMPLESALNQARGNTPWATFIGDTSITNLLKPGIRARLILPAEEFTSACLNSVEAFLTVMMRRWILIIDRILSRLDLGQYSELGIDERATLLAERAKNPIIEGLAEHGWTLPDVDERTLLSIGSGVI